MKLRNDGDYDRRILGIDFAIGAVVEIPDDLEPSKRDYLRREFTEVKARPKPKPSPPVQPPMDPEIPAFAVAARKKFSRKKRSSRE